MGMITGSINWHYEPRPITMGLFFRVLGLTSYQRGDSSFETSMVEFDRDELALLKIMFPNSVQMTGDSFVISEREFHEFNTFASNDTCVLVVTHEGMGRDEIVNYLENKFHHLLYVGVREKTRLLFRTTHATIDEIKAEFPSTVLEQGLNWMAIKHYQIDGAQIYQKVK